MQFLRYTKDVFGQKMLVGVNWDLMWIPVAAAGIVIVAHLVLRQMRRSAQKTASRDEIA